MVTTNDFQEFANFALPLIQRGEAESIAQLVDDWQSQREERETLESIARGIEDVKAGRVVPASEVFANIRKELGLDS